MITLLTGDNDFALKQHTKKLVAGFSGEAEIRDGEEMTRNELASVVSGATLFAEKRLVIVKNLHQNTELWADATLFFERVGEATHLVLVDEGVDKRSKTYKWLKQHADTIEFDAWKPRDYQAASRWMVDQAKGMGLELSSEHARQIIARTGLNQWKIYQALEKLTLVDSIDDEIIEATIDKTPSENVFALLETACRADEGELSKTLTSLKSSEDPYKVAGLLASQIMQLAVLAISRDSPAVLAKTLGVHPFVLSRLAPLAKTLGPARARRLVEVMAQTDTYMKTTSTDPWILVERVLSEARR